MAQGGRVTGKRLPEIDVWGRGRLAGSIYGEGARELIQSHLHRLYEANREVVRGGRDQLLDKTSAFRRAVMERYPELAEEIDGIADGAHIDLKEAWLLQLRSEVQRVSLPEPGLECTAIGVMAPATRNAEVLAGQNGDLPGIYEDILVVVRREAPQQLRSISVAPAGQISWHGMNEAGLAVFGNFLNSDGWRIGIPRYLYTRIALEESTVAGAVERLSAEHRSSSRNLLLADPGAMIDLELGVKEWASLSPRRGVLVHTNHFLSPLAAMDTAPPLYSENSRGRYEVARSLLWEMAGEIDLDAMKTVLKDRTPPHLISIAATDQLVNDLRTVVSSIAEVGEGRLWIAMGPPHLTPHLRYDL